MKKYDLMLQGGIKLTINEGEKREMEKAMLKGDSLITVGNNKFKSSIIKGIFEIKEEVSDNKEHWIESNRDWHEECTKLSKRNISEKIDSELVVRIFPGLKLSKITLTDETVAVLQANIKAYFDVFSNAPRCPMRIWWPIIADSIAPKNKKTNKRPDTNIVLGKWWEIISRNDGAIQEWLRYNN